MVVTIEISEPYEKGALSLTLVAGADDGVSITTALVDLSKQHELYTEDGFLKIRGYEEDDE